MDTTELLTIVRQEVRRRVRLSPHLGDYRDDLTQDALEYALAGIRRVRPRVPGAYARLQARAALRVEGPKYLSVGVVRDRQTPTSAPRTFAVYDVDETAAESEDIADVERSRDLVVALDASAERHPKGTEYLRRLLAGEASDAVAGEFGVSRNAVTRRAAEAVVEARSAIAA